MTRPAAKKGPPKKEHGQKPPRTLSSPPRGGAMSALSNPYWSEAKSDPQNSAPHALAVAWDEGVCAAIAEMRRVGEKFIDDAPIESEVLRHQADRIEAMLKERDDG